MPCCAAALSRGPFLAKEFLCKGEERKPDRNRTITEIGLCERELEGSLAIACRQIDRERFAASQKIVGRILQTEERTADARESAVKGDLLATALLHLKVNVNQALLCVGAKVHPSLYRLARSSPTDSGAARKYSK